MELTRIAGRLTFAAAGALLWTLALPAVAQNTGAQNAPEAPTAVDRQFVTDAIKANDKEIDQAQAELNGTSDANVRLFAQRVITDHTAANSQLAGVAKNLGIPYPQSHIEADQPATTNASPAPAANKPVAAQYMQPRDYMQYEVQMHQQAIGLYQGEIKNGGSQQLKSVAATVLPTVQAHLAMAQQYTNTGRITPVETPTPAANPPR